ncbi:hypothetical protein FG167_10480 [Lacinutrix sp. WUR7]|uniref:hypothetical protein n=1 Tax=Lacinutrix sp. WUR7 TaxID=2653681 RepID=UPI00193DAEB1|nr:hypothetical protein [Lacinutrix sp. WUR7]QRM89632.1 hypothetical protein FG167_10480 [Lacinutrix sp. WUR7]
MKTFTKTFKNVLMACFMLASTNFLAQTIITIDNNSGSTTTHQTIQAAHDAASAGDIIYVQPSGTSYGAVTIDKELTIVGRSHSEPSKISLLDGVIIRSSNVTLKGLKLSSLYPQSSGALVAPPFVGLTVYECNVSSLQLGEGQAAPIVSIDDVKVRGCILKSVNYIYEDATNVLFSNNIFDSPTPLYIYNTTSSVIANNVFRFQSSLTFRNNNPSGTAILYNNMFISNYGGESVINFRSGDFNLSNNLIYNYADTFNTVFANVSGGTHLESNTLANTDPLFTNVDSTVSTSLAGTGAYNPTIRLEEDLTLQAGSPALTGGGGGSEMGLYNNGFLYNTIGNPKGIPTLDVISYDGAVPKNGNINVTINAKAH